MERGIEQRLNSLTSNHNVLTPLERADEIKRYMTSGAHAFLKDMWKGQREMEDLVANIEAERAAKQIGNDQKP